MAKAVYLGLPDCRIESVQYDPGPLVVIAATVKTHCACPSCHRVSSSVHSYSTRWIDDLPKRVGDQLRLQPGDELDVEIVNEDMVFRLHREDICPESNAGQQKGKTLPRHG